MNQSESSELLEVASRLGALEKNIAKLAASDVFNTPRQPEFSIPTVGVVVLMATHNDSEFLHRGLKSIERSMQGHRWALVVCDDASDDDSLKICREFSGSADRVISLGFPKASTVSEAKNRCIKAASHLFGEFPWIVWHDPDDVMQPHKVNELLAKAIRFGHDVALGSYRFIDERPDHTSDYIHTAGRAYHSLTFGPWATVMHHSALPDNGRLFSDDNDVHEDLCGFWKLRARGGKIGVFDTKPVHEYRKRLGSHSEGREEKMLKKSLQIVHENPIKSLCNSFCTIVCGDAVREAEFFLRTLRLFNDQPVLVYCDQASKVRLKSLGLDRVRIVHDENLDSMFSGDFPVEHFNRAYASDSPSPHVMAQKLSVIDAAVKFYGNTLYLDCDTVVLGRLESDKDCVGDLGLVGHNFNGGWNLYKYGMFNGGQVFCNEKGVGMLRGAFEEFEKSWDQWSNGDDYQVPHSRFLDQGAFDMLPYSTEGKVFYFRPGHDVSLDVAHDFPKGDYNFKRFAQSVSIEVGFGIFFKGHPVKTFHVHLVKDPRKQAWRQLVIDSILASEFVDHQRVAEIVREIFTV